MLRNFGFVHLMWTITHTCINANNKLVNVWEAVLRALISSCFSEWLALVGVVCKFVAEHPWRSWGRVTQKSSLGASKPSHPSSEQQQVEQFSVINLTWTLIAHLWDRGPRLCKITVAHGAGGGFCRSERAPQTTEGEMHPCVTPNTTSTVSEQGREVGAAGLDVVLDYTSHVCIENLKRAKWTYWCMQSLLEALSDETLQRCRHSCILSGAFSCIVCVVVWTCHSSVFCFIHMFVIKRTF